MKRYDILINVSNTLTFNYLEFQQLELILIRNAFGYNYFPISNRCRRCMIKSKIVMKLPSVE